MSYKVIIDSCGELSVEMKADGHFQSIPLTIDVDDYHVIDDDSFNQKEFLEKVAASPNVPHSACPSPELYKQAFEADVDHVYAVTLSAELSGSCASAQLGKALCLEDYPDKKIYVFNSCSASVGETLIGLKIRECENKGMSFDDVVKTVEKYIASQQTWFVLESLETLRKNGRLSGLKAVMASVLSIKPIMISTPQGTITQLGQARGINRALMKMVENIAEITSNPEDRVLAISHCNCYDRAVMVKDAILDKISVKDVVIVDTAGISSMYANDGGIIVVI